MGEYKYIIGIDPDSTKSGIACINLQTKTLGYGAYSFPNILTYIDIIGAKCTKDEIKIVLEAGWLNKGNYHLHGYNSPQRAAKIGWAVGRNHQTGILLEELCKSRVYEVELVKPLKKIGKGKDGKISREELNGILQTYGIAPIGRCNQDVRDAILLCVNNAGFTPINNYKTERE